MNMLLLVDHYNIPWQRVTLKGILTAWASQVLTADTANTGSVVVRTYGGWFEGSHTSRDRFLAAASYGATCPSLVRANGAYLRIRFEFAESVGLQESTLGVSRSFPVTHTVARRDRAQHLQKKGGATCAFPDCQVKTLNKWIRKKRACPAAGCPNSFTDFFQHVEQKQVDVHLATDLLSYTISSTAFQHIAVVSDDIDFTPALIAASTYANSQNGGNPRLSLIRFVRDRSYADQELRSKGVELCSVPMP